MNYALSITSWASRGMGATHYYGRIKNEKGEEVYELTHVIDPKDIRFWDDSLWRALTKKRTEVTPRFLTKEDVVSAAKLWYRKNRKPGDTLSLTGV